MIYVFICVVIRYSVNAESWHNVVFTLCTDLSNDQKITAYRQSMLSTYIHSFQTQSTYHNDDLTAMLPIGLIEGALYSINHKL